MTSYTIGPLQELNARVESFVRGGLIAGDVAPSGESKIMSALGSATGVRDGVRRLRTAKLTSGIDIHPSALKMLVTLIGEHDLPDLVFADTETLGLDPYAPIWELAAVRRSVDTGEDTSMEFFVTHDTDPWVGDLPDEFRRDYDTRYDASAAITPYEAAQRVMEFFTDTPTLVGVVPSFDAERIARQWLEPLGLARPWHYHLECVSTAARGHLKAAGKLPRKKLSSDGLSAALGVSPKEYPRHTAMGDVRWGMAQWDVMGL